MKVALIQFNAGADKNDNVARALGFVQRAAQGGAQFIALPEIFNFRGDTRNPETVSSIAESVPGPSTAPFLKIAKARKVCILAGSVFEKAPNHKAFNASVLIDAKGKVSAKYHKIHLFDARLGDKIIRESDCFKPGRAGITAHVGDFRVGLSVCYDLRFPAFYSAYRKAAVDIITAPSCFTQKTGQAHWEVLLRARAIENLCYVLAPNQVGVDARGVAAYGNSMIISPWGDVLARASSDKEEIIQAEISKEEIKKARAILPGIIK